MLGGYCVKLARLLARKSLPMTYPAPGSDSPQGHDPHRPISGAPASPASHFDPGSGYSPSGQQESELSRRPASVSAAAAAIVFSVALALFAAVFGAASYSTWLEAEDGPATSGETAVLFLMFGGPSLLLAAGFVVLALTVLRGYNAARITAFIAYGVALACNGCSGMVFLGDSMDTVAEAVSYSVTAAVALTLLMIVDIVVIVLLALPASGRWFHAMTRARRAR